MRIRLLGGALGVDAFFCALAGESALSVVCRASPHLWLGGVGESSDPAGSGSGGAETMRPGFLSRRTFGGCVSLMADPPRGALLGWELSIPGVLGARARRR